MTDKKVLQIRIFVLIIAFIISSWIFVDIILKTAKESAYRWHPNPIETVLFVISFITLANGVSYLSEILKKDKNYLKIFTGVLSVMIFIFTLIPPDGQNGDVNPFIMWINFIGLSICSILISVSSSLEWAKFKKRFRWFFPFIFAFNSGIYSFFIAGMILRNHNFSEGGIAFIGYGIILFLISMIVNLIVVLSLKNKIRGKY